MNGHKTIRWGIMGTGRIAHKFASELSYLPDASIAAVGSRTRGSAAAFGEEFSIPHRHGSYEDLAYDEDVDIVYVATPHTLHKENSLLCLRAGKAVLCEKPLTVNAGEAREAIREARERKLFFMEAMKMRFSPAAGEVRRLLSEGVIGEPRLVEAVFGSKLTHGPTDRTFDKNLAGGSLLDVGIYPISFASMVYGEAPSAVTGVCHTGATGVDDCASISLQYSNEALAALACSIRAEFPNGACITGTEGIIRLQEPFWRAPFITVSRSGRDDEILEFKVIGTGLAEEAAGVMAHLREGLTESPIMPLGESLSIMETMDSLRAQWGLKYPSET